MRRVVEPAAPAKPAAEETRPSISEADADHDAEGEEGNGDRRALIRRKILEALDLAVESRGSG